MKTHRRYEVYCSVSIFPIIHTTEQDPSQPFWLESFSHQSEQLVRQSFHFQPSQLLTLGCSTCVRRSWGLVETNRNNSSHSFTNVAPSALSLPLHPWHSASARALCLFSPWPCCRPGGWPRQILELAVVIQQDGAFCLTPSILALPTNEHPKGRNCPPDITAGREDLGSNYPDVFWASCPLKFPLKMLPVLAFWFCSSPLRIPLSPRGVTACHGADCPSKQQTRRTFHSRIPCLPVQSSPRSCWGLHFLWTSMVMMQSPSWWCGTVSKG